MSQDRYTEELSAYFEDIKNNDILGAETDLIAAIGAAQSTGDYQPALDELRRLAERNTRHVSVLGQPYRDNVVIEACRVLREMEPTIIGCVLGQVTS